MKISILTFALLINIDSNNYKIIYVLSIYLCVCMCVCVDFKLFNFSDMDFSIDQIFLKILLVIKLKATEYKKFLQAI